MSKWQEPDGYIVRGPQVAEPDPLPIVGTDRLDLRAKRARRKAFWLWALVALLVIGSLLA